MTYPLRSFLAGILSRKTSRRVAVGGVPALALISQHRAVAQDDYGTSGSENQAGVAEPGANAFEFVGIIQQLGMDFTLAGYVTNVAGVDSALLFDGADPLSRSEATARLSIAGSGTGTSRSILQNLFAVNAEGSLQFHAIEPGATFEDPASFTTGAVVTTASVTIQNVINVQAPQTGLATGFGTLVVDSAESFSLGDQSWAFGEPGLRYRLSFTGHGALHNPETLEATILIVGNGVVAG